MIETVLVIGGTTNGIGKAFAELVDSEPNYYKLFVPGPQEFDVTMPGQLDEWLTSREPMDYVFYSAGTKHLNWIEQMTIDDIKETFDVNVFGYINVVKALIQTQPHGRICAITSEAAVTPMRTSLDYCASKAALHMAIKCIAKEMGPDWQITGIMPGVVGDTDMTREDVDIIAILRGWSREETFDRLAKDGMIDKNDIAKLAYWILFESPQSMTGSIVEIRGGR